MISIILNLLFGILIYAWGYSDGKQAGLTSEKKVVS